MIRVGMITTNWNVDRCGIAMYALSLVRHMPADISVSPIFGPYDFNSLFPRIMAEHFDIVHCQFEAGFVGIFAPGVATKFKSGGARIVLTVHDNWPQNDRACHPFADEFDRVIAHQETGDGYTVIPSGIEVLENSPWSPENVTIGTSGFPLWQKRVLEVAQAAAILVNETDRVKGCLLHCPASQHVDTYAIERQAKAAFPPVRYVTDWWDYKDAQRTVASNLVNIYPLMDGKPGISSSARMGIGTGSHIVLSRSTMFMDIRGSEFSDEVEWIDGPANDVTPRKIADAVLRVIKNGKRPQQILSQWNWARSAEAHAEIYRSLVGQAVTA